MSDIKLFMMDVDGVLTDGSMYYSENGDELKRFSTYDGKSMEFLRAKGIKSAIITSETTNIVSNRAKKMQIDYLYQGVQDKLSIAQEICALEQISLDECSYIGDDVNDLELLQNVKISACPMNARKEIKAIKGIYQLQTAGGSGAVREFVEYLLDRTT